MHLHSFDCSFCAVVLIGIVLAVALSRYGSHVACNRLFTIIEGFHHASLIWRCLWQQEVVLEDAAISAKRSLSAAAVSLRMTSCTDLWSRALHVLHEPTLSFAHVLWRSAFVWVVESRGCGVRARAEVTGVKILVLLHQNNAIVLETLIKARLVTSNRATAAGEFTSVAYFAMGLVKWICCAICCWLSASTHGGVVASHLWTFTAVGGETHARHIHHVRVY